MRFIGVLCITLLATLGLAGCWGEADDTPPLPHPDASTFESGDLLWPALPGAVIPTLRNRNLVNGAEAPAVSEWEQEKRRFIEAARASGDPEQIAIANELEPLTYEEFETRYFDSVTPSTRSLSPDSRELSPFAAGLPQVGHVAIIEVDQDGKRWVIEAIPKGEPRYASLYTRFADGVVRTPYEEWTKIHETYNVWHGRVKDRTTAERATIPEVAKQFLGKDYWFWSFNLGEENAFYCSKLVWVSVWKALGLALDGNSSLTRRFWVTPKQLINAPAVEVLYSPAGDYGGGG